MANIKKFLDQSGIQYLWSKINMQDYPNNETLIAVLNAIDETKADKSELDNYLLKSDYDGSSGGASGSINVEEWTFTLVDGSTITKKMVIE